MDGPFRFTNATTLRDCKRKRSPTATNKPRRKNHPTLCWLVKDVTLDTSCPHGEKPCAVPARSSDDRVYQIILGVELTCRSASKLWKIPKLVRTMSAHLAQTEHVSIDPLPSTTSLLASDLLSDLQSVKWTKSQSSAAGRAFALTLTVRHTLRSTCNFDTSEYRLWVRWQSSVTN